MKNKNITVYTKKGTPLTIKESLKSAFVGRGYYLQDPTKKTREVKEDGK